MKKSFVFLISSALLSINAIGQHTSSIIGGTAIYLDKPFKYEFQELPEHYHETIIEFKRTYGYYLGYSNSYKFKNEISIEISPQFVFTQDEITVLDDEYYIDNTNGHMIYTGNVIDRSEKGASIGFMVPVSFKKNLFDSPLSVIAGVNFTADRLIVFGNQYTGLQDPAFANTYYMCDFYSSRNTWYNDSIPQSDMYGRYKSAPYTSRFGIGVQVGLEYQIAQFGITCNFVSTNLTHKPANSVSLGLKYNLPSRAKTKLSDSTRIKFKHSLGIAFGKSIGRGISYRYVPNKFGIQATIGSSFGNNDLKTNGGVTFIYKFFETERMNFYAYQSNLFYYRKNNYHNENSTSSTTKKYSTHGVGLGNEINIFGHFYVDFMASVAYSQNKGLNYYGNYYPSSDSKFELLLENALYYKF